VFIILIIISFISCTSTNNSKTEDYLNLSGKLSGNWKAIAFDGELHEVWKLEKNGFMQQQGYYIEKADTSYSAKTRIEKVGTDIILFSVIKDSNPKIFKAIYSDENEFIFENKDYKNPFQVKYEFIDDTNYKRTITGYENDSLVVYEFNFKKQVN
jgi:hypothetical protein